MLKKIYQIIIFLSVMALFSTCSTKKNTFVSRNYHNLTSYYNVYWNGDQAMQEALTLLKGLGHDNYSEILPVYQYGFVEDTVVTGAQLNRAIQKASKTIKKHSIYLKGQEHVIHIDDAYLLMGKAYIYMHDYSMARTVFNVISGNFPKDPVRYEAMLWAARSYIIQGDYDMAISVIDQVRSKESELLPITQKELPLVMADYYIRQKQYNEAIPWLETGVDITKERDLKNRQRFILAQIWLQEGEMEKALDMFALLTKKNLPLEMDFNARLNLALCYGSGGGLGNKEGWAKCEHDLNVLLKDEKNSRYFGRIYYVLGKVERQNKQIDKAIELYKKSVEISDEDKEQKLISSVELADLLYAQKDYLGAQEYYAIANDLVTPSHLEYFKVQLRAKNLSDLVANLEQISTGDSLLKIAKMSSDNQQKYAEKQADNAKKEQAAEQEKSKQKRSTTTTPKERSNFYFYNEQARNFGYNAFVKKWGRREFEDNWALTVKPEIAPIDYTREDPSLSDLSNQTPAVPAQKPVLTKTDPQYYLENVPENEQAIADLNTKVETALFNSGLIYFDKLEEQKAAIASFERLLKDYPNTAYKPQVYYHLYRIYHLQNNASAKKKYADLLKNEFPNSDESKKINDPNYAKKQQSGGEDEQLYEYTFEAFDIDNYATVIQNVQDAERKFPNSPLMGRMKYLEALSYGKMNNDAAGMQERLRAVKTQYAADSELMALVDYALKSAGEIQQRRQAEEQKRIQEERRIQDSIAKANQRLSPEQVEQSPYKTNLKAAHMCVVLPQSKEIRYLILQTKIADFNRQSYGSKNYSIGEKTMGGTKLVYVSGFKDAGEAMEYSNTLDKNEYVFGGIDKSKVKVFPITEENLNVLLGTNNVDDYLLFYKTTYNIK